MINLVSKKGLSIPGNDPTTSQSLVNHANHHLATATVNLSSLTSMLRSEAPNEYSLRPKFHLWVASIEIEVNTYSLSLYI